MAPLGQASRRERCHPGEKLQSGSHAGAPSHISSRMRSFRCAVTRVGSDELDGNSVGVRGQGLDVGSITGEDGSARLGDSDDERVDSRTDPGAPTQFSCSPCRQLADRRVDDAHLRETVCVGVTPGSTVQ